MTLIRVKARQRVHRPATFKCQNRCHFNMAQGLREPASASFCLAAFVLFQTPWLVVALILVGFFSGFYIVPLYTLLQHRAPKTSKGDLIATSNFVNVTGAICASLLFFLLVRGAHVSGVVPAAAASVSALARASLPAASRSVLLALASSDT